ncbi:MAG: response regulator transcription factor [Prevotellaceae bacterium]|jgi:DNA-binding NarL/FixJ family response regulator|nr:response regulator transcription factor [Prevotellaceae bacterium]
MQKITVIIVDDQELFRLGVRAAIESRHPDITIVGEAKCGADFFRLLENTTADLVLLDIILPDTNGIEIAKRLKTEYPALKILALSAENSASTVEKMLEIGVEGFISKLNSNPDILAQAIRSVKQGFEYFGRDISDIISRIYIAKKRTVEVSSEFSEQEQRIIEGCSQGLPAKLIADRLNISARTVDWHKSNIFRKLGINSSLEMVRFALKNGIIRME